MSEVVTTLVTLKCDIPGCSSEIACGNDFHYAEDNGWKRKVPIFDDRDYDLCPGHLQDLQDFVGEAVDTLDDVEPFPVMDLRDVLAGEQPRPGEEDITVPRLGLPNAKGVFDA